jgi:hypothetical protein
MEPSFKEDIHLHLLPRSHLQHAKRRINALIMTHSRGENANRPATVTAQPILSPNVTSP